MNPKKNGRVNLTIAIGDQDLLSIFVTSTNNGYVFGISDRYRRMSGWSFSPGYFHRAFVTRI
ncbi:MAG: hypothetical protein JW779_03855 [Candidatus Thorarchaeota archaeon]|nr:hypothetical protein [Candidatus Thorarchaeota archaeon]